MTKFKTAYIKPVLFSGNTIRYYVGDEASDVTRDMCHRLGRYFIVCDSLFSARAIADHAGETVVECLLYVF